MKEAVGGAFLIKLMLTFLALYIAFMAVALNYAKAFRVKNQIINYIEQYEGYPEAGETGSVESVIEEFLINIGYMKNTDCSKHGDNSLSDGNNGYCVYKLEDNNRGKIYRVVTVAKFDLPFGIGSLKAVEVVIKGETKLIHKF